MLLVKKSLLSLIEKTTHSFHIGFPTFKLPASTKILLRLTR